MIIVIVEDEPLIATRIKRQTEQILQKKLTRIIVKHSLVEADHYLNEHPIDLLLLDLNLNGKDGFKLLKKVVSGSFHTIIISAYTNKAIEAFDYGVLDFVGKPFTVARLEKAFDRYENFKEKNTNPTKYISVKNNNKLLLLKVEDIRYIKAADIYSNIMLNDGKVEIHNKSLNKLETILPSNFIRTHKSYIINMECVKNFSCLGGSKYNLELITSEILPVSRIRYKEIKHFLNR